jgi:hypothetical protein
MTLSSPAQQQRQQPRNGGIRGQGARRLQMPYLLRHEANAECLAAGDPELQAMGGNDHSVPHCKLQADTTPAYTHLKVFGGVLAAQELAEASARRRNEQHRLEVHVVGPLHHLRARGHACRQEAQGRSTVSNTSSAARTSGMRTISFMSSRLIFTNSDLCDVTRHDATRVHGALLDETRASERIAAHRARVMTENGLHAHVSARGAPPLQPRRQLSPYGRSRRLFGFRIVVMEKVEQRHREERSRTLCGHARAPTASQSECVECAPCARGWAGQLKAKHAC